ncbi:hypothetical protein EB796_006948 [Bugula neritina]|uniref:CCHC-type domain-containing protein n=1 Tax=Bugula neritina TaxID=10212 RepID=A0A7J7K7Y1_BUGNE|nr:hypothetical protein EB796_006948 [Bugula neritina]
MIRTCHRCKSTEHEVASCPEKWCHKCHQIGHLKSSCTNTALCVVCGSTDYSFASCPESYSNKLALKTTWSRPPRSSTQTSDQEKKTPKAQKEPCTVAQAPGKTGRNEERKAALPLQDFLLQLLPPPRLAPTPAMKWQTVSAF